MRFCKIKESAIKKGPRMVSEGAQLIEFETPEEVTSWMAQTTE